LEKDIKCFIQKVIILREVQKQETLNQIKKAIDARYSLFLWSIIENAVAPETH